MPDHVKHPERYTAYVLDEPIVVGSGEFGTADKQSQNAGVRAISCSFKSACQQTRLQPDLGIIVYTITKLLLNLAVLRYRDCQVIFSH